MLAHLMNYATLGVLVYDTMVLSYSHEALTEVLLNMKLSFLCLKLS